jgi:plasmid stabilization system protein ParE
MKVVITETASESLWPIYLHHLDYSLEYAEAFQYEIDRFIVEHLSDNPLLGRLYHEARGIRRLVFQKRYNIYYAIRREIIFVLCIFDGRMEINQDIEEHGLDVEALTDGDGKDI